MPFLGSLAKAFRDAGRGLVVMVQTQRNVRIHCVIGLLAIGAGAVLGLSRLEWTAVLLCIVLVLAAETANTALELLADALHPDQHPLIGRAKDVAAAGVLVTAIGATVVGILVFAPKLGLF